MKVSDYPLLKTLILFLIGFFIAYSFQIELYLLLILLTLIIIITLLLIKIKPSLGSIMISFGIIITGCLVFSSAYYEDDKEIKLLDKLNGKKVLFYGKVSKIDFFDDEKIQFILKSDYLILKNKSIEINQKVFVNLNLKENSLPLNYFKKIISPGNYIRISGILSVPAEPKFVGDFDQKFYLKSKDINYILKSTIFDDLNLIEENNSLLNLSRHLNELRQEIKSEIEQNFDFLTAAYIKGLFIAERSDIPEDIKEDFVNSGVIHVLAVSGLHTGYIALILFAFTGRLNKWLKLIFVTLGLFVFAHIANLSPSVVRASIMSVVVLLALLIERKNSLINSIAIAALIILTFNPLDIFNPGFQLSFAAVLSIAIIYPTLQKIFFASKISGWKKYLLDLILISLAVSIGTFPFVATYYQKFSLISLLANLIVIPLTGVILGGIILNLIVINLLPIISGIYKLALTQLISLNFSVVRFFANLPFAYTSIKNFSTIGASIYFLMIGMIILILNRNYKPILKLVFLTLMVFNFSLYWNNLNPSTLKKDNYHLMLIKLHNTNSIFVGNEENNFLKIFEKVDSINLVEKDFNRLNKILGQMDLDKIHTASFSTHSIWFTNHLRSYIDNHKIHRLDDKIWLFGEYSNTSITNEKSVSSNLKYKFIKNSYTEIVQFDNWFIIITSLDLNKVKLRLPNGNQNLIIVKPNLDTMLVKLSNEDFKISELNFENTGMKIFGLRKDELEEIKWK